MTAATVEEALEESEPTKPADERLAYRGLGLRMLIRPEIVGIIGAAAIFMFFWGVTRPFGTAAGAATVLDVSATLGIMAVAVTLLMIGGEFDLSSGAMTGAMGIVIILLIKDVGPRGGLGLNYWVAIPISLLVALGIGWLNGTMVHRTKLPSFIVTLATFFVLRGMKLAYSKIVVDQIQVGRADEGGGYETWRQVFGSTWTRLDHVWEARDTFYTIFAISGGVLIALAIYEFGFKQRKTHNPVGIAVIAGGAAAVVAGVLLMHNTDGGDWLNGAIIGLGGLAMAFGLAMWRYEPLADGGGIHLGRPELIRPLGLGLGLVAAAAVIAAAMDAYSSEAVYHLLTVQGARAILFFALLSLGGVYLWNFVYRARQVSPATKSVAMLIVALVVASLAFFVQSESQSHKFRAELFTTMLVAAALIAAWGIVSMRFEIRDFTDAAADGRARLVAAAGLVLLLAGICIRMLFVVEAEIIANDPSRLAKFSVRILWFIAFSLAMSWMLQRTKFGSWTFAVGGNTEAARQVGVPAARTKTQLFMLVAFAAWLVGVLLAFRLNTIQAGTGNGEEFEYIIAAVVGGTMLTGGFGSAIGGAIGAVILAMAFQGISFAGWNTDWRFVFVGAILLVAVSANQFVRKLAEAAR